MTRVLAAIAVFVLALVASACGNDDTGGIDVGSGGESLDGRTFLSQQVTEDGSERALVAGTDIRLTFGEDEIRANAGCNHLFGTIESTDGGVLSVGPMGGTEMGCDPDRHAQDDWIMGFLTSSPTWLLSDDDLTLVSGSTEIHLTDRRVADPDRALEGTRWIVDTILDGDTASSTPSDDAYLEMSDGEISGNLGCNGFSGTYEITGFTIRFSSFVQTDMRCEDDVMRLEEAVAAISSAEVEYSIEARRLILVTPDGQGLGLHAAD